MAVKGRGGSFLQGLFSGGVRPEGDRWQGVPTPPIEGDGGASESRDTSTNMSVLPALF